MGHSLGSKAESKGVSPYPDPLIIRYVYVAAGWICQGKLCPHLRHTRGSGVILYFISGLSYLISTHEVVCGPWF